MSIQKTKTTITSNFVVSLIPVQHKEMVYDNMHALSTKYNILTVP